MKMDQMRVGVWLYGLGTIATGSLDVVWRQFEAAHQPIQALCPHIPGVHALGVIAGILLIAAGIALLWRPTARIGAAGSAILYLIFVTFWLARAFTAIHALGWRINVIMGLSFGIAQLFLLVAPAAILYALTTSPNPILRKRAAIAARWMLGLPPIVFGLLHLNGIHFFATIVPQWMPFRPFWAALTGVAFVLSGAAIVFGIRDVLAARLLALMLLLFEFMVEIPPIFTHVHSQRAWGAAVYNLTAIGACWIFAEFIAARLAKQR